MQLSAEFDDGLPYTIYVKAPLEIEVLPILTDIENALVFIAGEVEKAKVAPPFAVEGEIEGELEEETRKSADIPVVAPASPETVIVHEMPSPARMGLPVVQDRLDPIEGLP